MDGLFVFFVLIEYLMVLTIINYFLIKFGKQCSNIICL